jgi:hypothetical protein
MFCLNIVKNRSEQGPQGNERGGTGEMVSG